MRAVLGLTLLTLVALAGSARAEVAYTFKHDQFSDGIDAASMELSGITLPQMPGFAAGEAFGVVFRPTDDMYPVKIEGIDVVVAGMPNDIDNSKAHAMLEIYFFDGDGPDPGTATPTYSLSTYDVYNEVIMDIGQPLLGSTGMSFDFDWSDTAGHPPMLQSGNFLVAVRFLQDAQDLQTGWGTSQCALQAEAGMCGCQKVATIHDQISTPSVNVLHIISTPLCCDCEADKWVWFEEVGANGDVLLRARAKIQDGPCVPACLDKDCGDDGCGGSCGECGEDEECVQGFCQEGACVPACDGKECGDDGCGGVCGVCGAGMTCNASGQCVEGGVCDPVANCVGKDCGDDGCGGVCGVCEAGEDCVQGTCTEDGGSGDGEFKITSVSPSEGCNDEDIAIMIRGDGFTEPVTVYLDAFPLVNPDVVDRENIRVVVPAGMKTGTYDLVVSDGENNSASFALAYKVIRCGNTGCGVGDPASSTGLGLLLLLAGLALAWRRVRI